MNAKFVVKVIATGLLALPAAVFAHDYHGAGIHGGGNVAHAGHVGAASAGVPRNVPGFRPGGGRPVPVGPRSGHATHYAGGYYGGHGYPGHHVGGPYYGRPYYGHYYGRPYYRGYYPHGYYSGFYGGLALGAFVATLPLAYDTFWYSGVPYYYADNVYYRYNTGVQQYEVVQPPSSGSDPEGDARAADSADLYAYPKNGQSEEQQKTDRYECHRWAADKSGFDPTSGVPAQGSEREDYQRAEGACLEGRGYSVN